MPLLLPKRLPLLAASSLALVLGFEKSFFALRKICRLSVPIGAILLHTTMTSSLAADVIRDPDYPGTAVTRLQNVHARVKSLTTSQLNGDWEEVRRSILWAGGLRDLPTARPGLGYTGHSFNDFNHVGKFKDLTFPLNKRSNARAHCFGFQCDLTTMLGEVSSNENLGRVSGIAYSNQLGPGIKVSSTVLLVFPSYFEHAFQLQWRYEEFVAASVKGRRHSRTSIVNLTSATNLFPTRADCIN
jgi:hypothetical protein